MPYSIATYKGYPIITPDPPAGLPARAVNDAVKQLVDTSVQVLGQFPATNFSGAMVHFSRNNYNYFYCETTSPGYGGLFPAVAQTTNLDYCREDVGFPDFCNECGCWCNWGEGMDGVHNAPFSLCAVNAQYFQRLSINLKSFLLNPPALLSFTSLLQLKLNEMTLTNKNLVITGLNVLTTLNIHVKLAGSSTVSISNLPALTTLWMSGESYGGMQGLTDANFTLDIPSLPNITYIALYEVGTGLSTAFWDNLLIALAASVVANPRTGFIDISGTDNPTSGASAAAIAYLTGPGGWSVSYNS